MFYYLPRCYHSLLGFLFCFFNDVGRNRQDFCGNWTANIEEAFLSDWKPIENALNDAVKVERPAAD